MKNLYYQKPGIKLYLDDSLKILQEIPENSIDMIFADPPYFLSSGSFTCQNGKMVSVKKGDWDLCKGVKENFDFHFKWIEACKRVLKPKGTIWISGTYHSIYQCGFALQANNFHILNDISWFKPNASPNLSCRFFTASHETLIWARKDKKAKHTFNYDKMKNGDWPDDQIKKPGLQMRSVWSIHTPKTIEKKFGKHPTQKPEALLKRIILASTNKGDVILDPFSGSSTTGVIAHLYGRNFIGIDMEKDYLDLSIKRFEELRKNLYKKEQYIPVEEFLLEGSSAINNSDHLKYKRKFLIKDIKIDSSKFSFKNKINELTIEKIINNFDFDFWEPILLSDDYYLLDGKHRLKVAQKLGLKYIDVIIQDKNTIYRDQTIKKSSNFNLTTV